MRLRKGPGFLDLIHRIIIADGKKRIVRQQEPALTEDRKRHIEKLFGAVQRLYQPVDDIVALTKEHLDNEREKKVALNSLEQSGL